MTRELWKSAFVAVLFALHPLHVEPVAWIACRKDVLSTFAWMLTLWAYLRYVEGPNLKRYLLVFLLFTLGLMAKPMLITLPFVLLLLDYWPLGRLQMPRSNTDIGTSAPILPLILEKAPLFTLSVVSCIITFFAEKNIGALPSLESFPIKIRIANALISYVTYMEKMILPHDLAVFYPHPGNALSLWYAGGFGLILLFMTVLMILVGRLHPYFTVGWLWYLGTLVPVIGLIQIGTHAMADRYTYIPFIGLFILITWGIPSLLSKWHYSRVVLILSGGIVISLLIIGTWSQLKNWRNSVTLFEHALRVTSDNYKAHYNLGVVLWRQGKAKQALTRYNNALRIKPDFVEAHYNLGFALSLQGNLKEAITHYSEVLRIKPNHANAHNNLGVLMAQQKKLKKAVFHFSEAVRADNGYAEAHYNLGNALAQQGKIKKAISQYYTVLRLQPGNAGAHYNLANALTEDGELQKATVHYLKALRIKPRFAEAHNNLGLALARQGKIDEAIVHFSKAVEVKPDFQLAQENLNAALKEKHNREKNQDLPETQRD